MWYHPVTLIRECALESLMKGLLCPEARGPGILWEASSFPMCVVAILRHSVCTQAQ